MHLKREEGAAAVEFALVLPILLVIVFGIIEFGFIWYYQGVVATASREGARYGVIVSRPADIVTKAQNYANQFLPSASSATINPPDTSTAAPGTDLTVTVKYDYPFILLSNFIPGLGPVLTLTGATTMQFE